MTAAAQRQHDAQLVADLILALRAIGGTPSFSDLRALRKRILKRAIEEDCDKKKG